jgi:CelD/BcsL family acetyltransferase involved in cellulose biosynthesis
LSAQAAPTLEVVRGVERVASEWDALADRLRAAPFLRPAWIAAWARAFGTGPLEIFTLRLQGRLLGMLPLVRSRGVLTSPTNWHTPRFGLLSECEPPHRLLQQTLLSANGARRVSLAFLDPGREPLEAWTAGAEEHGFRVLTRTLAHAACVEIQAGWDEYECDLKRSFRSNLRRSLRRLREAGTVAFEVLDGRDGLDSLLTEGFGVESSGWKAARGTAITSRPETEAFYRSVGAWAAERGWLRLAFLRLDGRAIAFEFALEEGGVYYALKSGFDPAYRGFSPGTLLIHSTLELAFSRGLRRYELGKVETYKLAWANAFSERALFQAFAPSPPGLVDWAAFRYGRPLAKRMLNAIQRGRLGTGARSSGRPAGRALTP